MSDHNDIESNDSRNDKEATNSAAGVVGEENILDDLLRHPHEENLFDDDNISGKKAEEIDDNHSDISDTSHHSDFEDNEEDDKSSHHETDDFKQHASEERSDISEGEEGLEDKKDHDSPTQDKTNEDKQEKIKEKIEETPKIEAKKPFVKREKIEPPPKSDDEETKPAKKNTEQTTNEQPKKKARSYDYATKLNYLFRGARFFLVKSNNTENVTLAKSKGVWSTPPANESRFNQAFEEARNVLLVFSVKESGKFAGVARLATAANRNGPQVPWVLPAGLSARQLGGVFRIQWISKKELSFQKVQHLTNAWNEDKPIKIGRDGQEIEPKSAEELCRLFPVDNNVDMTPILRRSKESARIQRAKPEEERRKYIPTDKPLSANHGAPPTRLQTPINRRRDLKRRNEDFYQDRRFDMPKRSRGAGNNLSLSTRRNFSRPRMMPQTSYDRSPRYDHRQDLNGGIYGRLHDREPISSGGYYDDEPPTRSYHQFIAEYQSLRSANSRSYSAGRVDRNFSRNGDDFPRRNGGGDNKRYYRNRNYR